MVKTRSKSCLLITKLSEIYHNDTKNYLKKLYKKRINQLREPFRTIDECCMCLEDVSEIDKYQNPCGCAGIFHTTCIVKYLNNRISINVYTRISPPSKIEVFENIFNCPYCRQKNTINNKVS